MPIGMRSRRGRGWRVHGISAAESPEARACYHCCWIGPSAVHPQPIQLGLCLTLDPYDVCALRDITSVLLQTAQARAVCVPRPPPRRALCLFSDPPSARALPILRCCPRPQTHTCVAPPPKRHTHAHHTHCTPFTRPCCSLYGCCCPLSG